MNSHTSPSINIYKYTFRDISLLEGQTFIYIHSFMLNLSPQKQLGVILLFFKHRHT